MTVNGVEFDDPREGFLSKRDYSEYMEGKRTSVKELWVLSYYREGNATCTQRHCIRMTNRGACSIDGTPVRDEADKKKIADIFATLKPA